MKVGWLIDGDLFDHYRDDLITAIRDQGHDIEIIGAPKPPYRWDDVGCSYRDAYAKNKCVIAHGDIELIARIHQEQRWTPGVFADVQNYFCSNYYCWFSEYLLNRDYIMMPFGELAHHRDRLFDMFPPGHKMFVRPDSPLKLFTGQLVTRDKFDADLEFLGFYEFPRSSIVVVSAARNIVAEWRFVVVNRKVVAGCQYKRQGKLDLQVSYDASAFDLATKIAGSDYQPDPAWVLDICETDDGDFHLLEVGGFSFSDLYLSDKQAIVAAVSEAALAQWRSNETRERN